MPLPGTGVITAAWAASPDALVLGTARGGVQVRHGDGGYDTLAEGSDARVLNDLWGMGATERWAVGNAGLVLRWNGTDWRPLSVPTTNDLLAVWGSGPGEVWAVGSGGSTGGPGTDYGSVEASPQPTYPG